MPSGWTAHSPWPGKASGSPHRIQPSAAFSVNANNQPVGEGFHQYDLRNHAEVVALKQAGALAKNTTAYVTLEPCSHTGRTGPCSDALIAAQVSRVVIATLDANPIVRGNGVARLREAGIAVDIGIGEHEAQQLNNAFAKYICTGLPWVTLKSAISLDERIAPAPFARTQKAPFWLTSEASRAEVQSIRHAHDALLTGIGTILADDPLLTDRSGLQRRRPLLRVILDSHLRLPLDARLLEIVNEDVLIFTTSTDTAKIEALRACGAKVEILEANATGISLQQVFARLGELKIISVMIEAGTHINTTALSGNFVDELVTFQAPISLGTDALPFVDSPVKLPAALHQETTSFGPDTCTCTLFKTWWH